ncbi:MAG TPA: glycoside hydrolase domain-containing protein [Thermoguttaceae bacterium]|nr:glycoside hydrolase domain-containing protein [Thermoguttaceae bacterium]
MSEKAPEFRYFHRDMLSRPKRPYVIDRLPGMDAQMTYYACTRGAWQDLMVATTAQCMDEYDTDGVYLDTTVRPHACRNRLHGCGYVAPDGTLRSTYPVFATRRLMKRLYTVVKSRKPDGIVDAHVYDCLNVPALAFSTSYWNGEQLPHREFKTDALPLDRFRTEFMGHNLGVPADVLYYCLGDYDACAGLALLHDVPVRSEGERDFAILSSIWRVREAFGCKDAEFIGYWKAGDLVKIEPQGCYASLWRHPTSGVLAAVANLRREPADVRVTFDRQKLGLGPQMSAEDARTGKPFQVDGNRLSLGLGPQGWTLVRIPLAR